MEYWRTYAGWFYFSNVGAGPRIPRWEFAPCAETSLTSVTRVPTDFCDSSDPRRLGVFGNSSTTNAIRVSVGQILFARRTDETNRIYVLNLKEQHGNKLVVNYCVTTP